MNLLSINELMILAQQGTGGAYRAGQIFGYIFLIVLAIAVIKKLFGGE